MTDLAIIDDHTEQALGLLIGQYRDLPRLSGLVTSITNRLQEFEDINWDVTYKRLLEYTARDGTQAYAVGAQLNTIGRIVGQGRGGQDDDTYRLYIRAKIFLNKSRAKHDDVIRLLQLVEPAAFEYSEYSPATVWIQYTEPPAAARAVLVELARRAVTGGVQLFLVAPTDDDAFIIGDSSIPAGTPDTVHGLSDVAETMGGTLSEIW